MLASSAIVSGDSPSQSFASHPSSNSHTKGGRNENQDAGGSSHRCAPNAASMILLDTLPYIAQYGFTWQAYLHSSLTTRSASADLDPQELNRRLGMLSTLFPGPESVFSSALFVAWNDVSDLCTIHSLPAAQVVDSLRSAKPLASSSSCSLHRPVQIQTRLSKEQEQHSLAKVSHLIEQRLRLSWTVKSHLQHGLTSLSTASPTTSRLHSIFPHETVLPNLPNPWPLLQLSSALVSNALIHPLAQQRTRWIDPDGPEWYAVRTRLTAAYTAATLHMASESILDFQSTQTLFRTIVQRRESGIVATLETLAASANQWIMWGARGWLGTFRSLGL